MKQAKDLIARLFESNIRLWVEDGDRLRFSAPKGAMTAQLKSEVVAMKPDLIAFLQDSKEQLDEKSAMTIVPAPRDGTPMPLSFSQQRLWFLEQFEGDKASYNLTIKMEMKEPLGVKLLRRVLEDLMMRHETLYTRFETRDGEPGQVIDPDLDLPLIVQDLIDKSPEEKKHVVSEVSRSEVHHRFNLAVEPAWRINLMAMEDDYFATVITMHHIITDDWSFRLFLNELGLLHQSYASGRPNPLKPLPIQYADFTVWQHKTLSGKGLERRLTFWKDYLEGMPAELNLPTDHPRPPILGFKKGTVEFYLESDSMSRLETLSQTNQVTLYMTFQAAFLVFLFRYSGQRDIVLGTPVNGRNRAEVELLIGLFINTLVLRTNFEAEPHPHGPHFVDLLTLVKKSTTEAFRHDDLPFGQLVNVLQPERHLSRTPLFQAMFNMRSNLGGEKETVDEISTEIQDTLELEDHSPKYDLTLTVDQGKGVDGLAKYKVALEYSTDLFDHNTVTRMADHFSNLLHAIVANPKQRIGRLSLSSDEEMDLILRAWNNTRGSFPHELCINQLFEAQAERTPDAIAVVVEDRELSYRELELRANRLAHHLRGLGVKAGVRVGLFMERSVEMMVSLIAIHKAGGAYVPMDTSLPPQRLSFILDDAQIKVLLTMSHLVEKLPDHPVLCVVPDVYGKIDNKDAAEDNPVTINSPDNLAYVIYTSGSTGIPKGVCVRQSNVVNFMAAMDTVLDYDAANPGTWVAVTNVSFDISVLELLWSLTRGLKVVVMTTVEGNVHIGGKQDGEATWSVASQLVRHNATHLQCTPSMAQILTMHDEVCSAMRGLKKLMLGGEAFPISLAEQLLELTDADIINMYGPTETTIWSATHPVREAGSEVPIGRPILNTDVYILDENLEPQPLGIYGELAIGGDGVTRGYLNRPTKTAEQFVPNPFSGRAGDRLYRTGDLVRYQNGTETEPGVILFNGRIDFQVKLRGFRIELGEIETRLMEHSLIKEAVVIVREDKPGDQRLTAYLIEARETASPTTGISSPEPALLAELKAFLIEKMPEYMAPSTFMFLDAYPLTPAGKIDRKRLPAPERSQITQTEFVKPESDFERMIADIWQEVLDLEKVGIHDNFFDLGGHSLLATKVMVRIRQQSGVELPLRVLFDDKTVAALARRVEEMVATDGITAVVELVPVPRDQPIPLSFTQQRLWFLEQLEPGNALYHLAALTRLTGQLDVTSLERCFETLIERHESLRTTFSEEEGNQIIKEPFGLNINFSDFQNKEDPEAEMTRFLAEEARQPFDLVNGPLIRVSLIKLDPEEHVLLINMHHIISDGWSMGLLVQETAELYKAFTSGMPSPLAPLPIQYADYAVWLRNREDELARQLDWWVNLLGHSPPVLELPIDHPRPPIQTYRGHTLHFEVSPQLRTALEEQARAYDATLFMVLMAGWQVLLHRYSNQDRILVGAPIANRTLPELEGLIGFFANSLVFPGDFSANPSLGEYLTELRGTSIDIFDHQDLPFERLVDATQTERNLSHAPLTQTFFMLVDRPRKSIELDNLSLSPVSRDWNVANFDISLQMTLGAEGISGAMNYCTDLFARESMERMANHFLMVLEALTTTADSKISRLPLLTREEKQTLIIDWNDTREHRNKNDAIHLPFEREAARNPGRTALIFDDVSFTYEQLNRKANVLAALLIRQGAECDRTIGICMDRSPEMLIALLAVLKSGAAYVPLDPSHPGERLNYIAADAGLNLMLTRKDQQNWDNLTILDLNDIDLESSAENPDIKISPNSLAYVIYTSGSTGRPKGVGVMHDSVVNFLETMARKPGLDSEDRLMAVTTLSFDIAGLELYLPLICGATLVLASDETTGDGDRLSRQIDLHDITVMQATPATWRMLFESGWTGKKNLRVFCGGEALPPDLAELLAGSCHSLWNMYGPTETTIWSAVDHVEAGSAVTIGRPIGNTQLYVMGPDLENTPIGVFGELLIGGEGLARGYSGKPGLTATMFMPDPFSAMPGSRLYRTGDCVRYLADGRIEYQGRMDHQVKLRGHRIELGEIEVALLSDDAIKQAVVLIREDRPGDQRLTAYLVLEQNATEPSSTRLRAFLKEKLPDYMIPSAYTILEALPLTPNLKVDRKTLNSPKFAPEAPRLDAAVDFIRPGTPAERFIAGVWVETLNLKQVGIHNNFFDLGGHSLLLVRVHRRLREKYPNLTMVEMFQYTTINSLATFVDQSTSKTNAADKGADRARIRGNRLSNRRKQKGKRKQKNRTE